jgi:hypothetical protein
MDDKKLEQIAKRDFEYSEEMYKLIDFLNKNLKSRDIVLGISKKNNKAFVTIYKI